MTQDVDFGLDGLCVAPRHHVCGIYSTPEDRDRVLQAYVRAGVSRGDKCVVALDEADPQRLLAGLGEAADVGHWLTSGQLDVRTTPPTQSESGLTVPEMQAVWDAALANSQAFPSGHARVTGEASSWLAQASVESLLAYEGVMNAYLPERVGMLCLYDLNRFGGGLVMIAVQAHPLVLVGTMVVENPWYVDGGHAGREQTPEIPAARLPTESDLRRDWTISDG